MNKSKNGTKDRILSRTYGGILSRVSTHREGLFIVVALMSAECMRFGSVVKANTLIVL